MKMKHRFLAAALLVIMLVATACHTTSNQPSDTTGKDDPSKTGTSSETVADTTEELVADVPKMDMDGLALTFLSANWASNDYQVHEIFAEGYNSEFINDAMYDRILYMESTYNCEVKVIPAFDASTGHRMIEDSVMADAENVYDFYLDKLNRYAELARQGYLLDLAELPHNDFEQPWWDTNSYNDLSICGYHFAVCSDITLVDKDYTSMLAFNTQLYTDILPDEELPYELVRSGDWTFDALYGLAKRASSDDVNNERYGLAIFRDTLLTFMVGGDYAIGGKDENDVPHVTLDDEATMNWSLHLMEKFYDELVVCNIHALSEGDGGSGTLASMFEENKTVFTYVRGNEVEFFRQTMEADFGILPTPKRNEEQKEYYTDVNPWGGVCLVMPINSGDDLTEESIFLEDFACQGRKTVLPQYFNVLLDYRYARDDDSKEMLDIVYRNRRYDVGAIGNWNNYAYDYIAMTTKKDLNLSSFVNSNLEAINAQIDYLKTKIDEKYNKD